MNFAFAEPTEWWLEITPAMRTAAWEQQPDATPASRWNAYLNHICLSAFLPWLQVEHAPEATGCPPVSRSGWETVNGTAIQIGTTRIVLIPSEAIDSRELEVPQEWVDIPSWAADYYLAVQVQLQPENETASLASQWLRVWGYTTHQDLKTIGDYDPDDRTYCLAAPDLTQDLTAFWVTLQLCPEAQTRTAIAPLPELSALQIENLLQRLNRSEVAFPRLAIPFAIWGALLEQIQQNQAPATLTRNWVNLSQWLQQRVEGGWQTLETLFGAAPDQLAFSFRSAREAGVEVTQGKLIELAAPSQSLESQTESQFVLLLVGLSTEADQRVGITAQVHPNQGNTYVPDRLTLALCSEAGDILQSVQAAEADNYIQLRRFRCVAGTRFQLQVTLDDRSTTEDFIA